MSATALRGQHQPRQGDDQRDASRTKLAHSIGSLCPDELAVYNAVREARGRDAPQRSQFDNAWHKLVSNVALSYVMV